MTELLLDMTRPGEDNTVDNWDYRLASHNERRRRALALAMPTLLERAAAHINVNLFHEDTPSAAQNGSHPDRQRLAELDGSGRTIPELMMARFALAEENQDIKALDLATVPYEGEQGRLHEFNMGVQIVHHLVRRSPTLTETFAEGLSVVEPGYIPADPDYVIARNEYELAGSEPYLLTLHNVRRGEAEDHEAVDRIIRRDIFVLHIPGVAQLDGGESERELFRLIGDARAVLEADGEWQFSGSYEVTSQALKLEMARCAMGEPSAVLQPAASTVIRLRQINDDSVYARERHEKALRKVEAHFARLEGQASD